MTHQLVKIEGSNIQINIGKVLFNNLKPDNFQVIKDKNKQFKINQTQPPSQNNLKNQTSNRQSTEISFTGNLMTDQTSQYLLFNVKKDSNLIEVMPVSNWFQFFKDVKNAETAEEIEEKLKLQVKTNQIYENILSNKPKPNQKKDVLKKENKKLNPTTNKHYISENKDNPDKENSVFSENNSKNKKNKENFESDDDEKVFNKAEKKRKRSDSNDSIPSNLKAMLDLKEKEKEEKSKSFNNLKKELEEEDEESEEDDLFDEKERKDEGESQEDEFLFENLESEDRKRNEFIGKKRESKNETFVLMKASIEEEINKILTRFKSITYENIKKELANTNMFTINQIKDNLNLILDQKCSKYRNSDGVEYFCKKISK